jgi:hypothetical protein
MMKTKVTTTSESTPGWSLQDDISGLSQRVIRKRAIELNRERIYRKDEMINEAETKNAKNNDEEKILSSDEPS